MWPTEVPLKLGYPEDNKSQEFSSEAVQQMMLFRVQDEEYVRRRVSDLLQRLAVVEMPLPEEIHNQLGLNGEAVTEDILVRRFLGLDVPARVEVLREILEVRTALRDVHDGSRGTAAFVSE